MTRPAVLVVLFAAAAAAPAGPSVFPAGWTTAAPRDEIRPAFGFDPAGGPKKDGAFVITHDAREGQHGWVQKAFPVEGGKHYRFHAVRKATNVEVPRRSVAARVLWRDAAGRGVPMSEPAPKGYLVGFTGRAEAEHPTDRADFPVGR